MILPTTVTHLCRLLITGPSLE